MCPLLDSEATLLVETRGGKSGCAPVGVTDVGWRPGSLFRKNNEIPGTQEDRLSSGEAEGVPKKEVPGLEWQVRLVFPPT